MSKKRTITIVDCETGGLDFDSNPITNIALLNLDIDTFKVNWEWETFIKPYGGLEIEQVALDKSLVTMKQINSGMDSDKVVKELIKLFKSSNSSAGKPQGNTIICGHNIIGFDREFLEYIFLLHGEDIYDYVSKEFDDTLVTARKLWFDQTKNDLGSCCERIGYKLVGAHGAMNDVRATFELWKYLTKRLRGGQVQVGGSTSSAVRHEHRNYFNF